MTVSVHRDYEELSRAAARLVADRVRQKPNLVLGLASGSTPVGLYRELIRMHNEEGLSFSGVTTFNLDEYVGLPTTHPKSYHHWMWEVLFSRIDIRREAVLIPDCVAGDIEAHCEWYESEIKRRGGIDLQILGIGANGHIGFNEPGSLPNSRTRMVMLSERTINDNARFFGSAREVPKRAITMGIATIMQAREILLMASGEAKAEAIRATVEGPIASTVPGSMLQRHRNVHVLIDHDASSKLRRMAS